MKISLNWLQNFVTLTEKNQDKIKEIITARSAEIETMENIGAHLDKVVLGRIEKIMPHPNADKLKITIVDNGEEKLKVVCGGSNLKEGMKVALAQLGAVVKWHGTEVVKMEKAKIRGEESFGMICASEEIGLQDMFPKKEEKEIVDLSHLDAPIGTPLAKVLGLDDTVIDIDNHAITHRADLFSHMGFAREFVACGLAKWKKSVGAGYTLPKTGSPAPITIEMESPELCRNYLGVYITGIDTKESPDWMKKRLSACGIRPISNLVDITNFVMLELGMPMHAFDLDQVKGKKWVMRKSKKGEKVVTLDQKEIELIEGVTILDDGNEIFDLCGIMGGFNSGIGIKTNRIWLHAPVYNPSLTRRAVRGMGTISDAAIIYEKGVDTELAKEGLARAIELILELCTNAKVASEVTHIQPHKSEKRELNLRDEQQERMIGFKIPAKDTKTILTNLGFGVTKAKGGYKIAVPSWRMNDVKGEADIIEEVARVYSYDKIPFTTPVAELKPISINSRRVLQKQIKDKLVSFGFNEIYTFAFLGTELLAKCGMKPDHGSISIANPISSDMSIMRQSLLPRTLQTVADNLRFQKQFRMYEITRTFHRKGENAEEKTGLIIASVGENFRDLQGVVENLGLSVEPMDSKECQPHQHPGRAGALVFHGKKIGSVYEIHPQIEKNFDLKTRVTVAEVDFEALHELGAGQKIIYKELPKFPAIQLDVSLLIPKKQLAETFFHAIKKTDQALIKDIRLVDEYAGEKIEKDKRSLTFSITYRSDKETLTDIQVNAVHQKVLANLKTAGASIRD
ncbi:phenylalanine--tRNA ligase subunit beta [Candidatus Peregrinibacteria bacterium]|nr:phenylalanine--tRNA ligase subunit beta [Candidatus Peregrinibacteria bacterium]